MHSLFVTAAHSSNDNVAVLAELLLARRLSTSSPEITRTAELAFLQCSSTESLICLLEGHQVAVKSLGDAGWRFPNFWLKDTTP